MLEILKQKQFQAIFGQQMDFRGGHKKIKQVIYPKLKSSNPYHVIAALEMIRILKDDSLLTQIGNLLLKTQSFEIKRYCLNTLAVLPRSYTNRSYLEEALRTEQDAKVLPLIIKNLANFKSANLNKLIEKFLEHPTPSVFIEACLFLHKTPKDMPKRLIEDKILVRIYKVQLPQETASYLYALGELHRSHYSDKILPFLDSDKPEVRLAAFTAFIRLYERQLEPHKDRLIKVLDLADNNMKILALRALKNCQPLKDWEPVIRLLGAMDHVLVKESKELLQLNLGVCKPLLIELMFSDKLSAQQRFEILSLIYHRFSSKQRQHLQEIADEALRKFILVNGLLKLHESLEHTSKTHGLITKVLQEIAEEHLALVLTVITFAADHNRDFFQRVSDGLKSLSRANQGNALEVLSNVREKYLVNRLLKYFDERFINLNAIRRIYFVLFGKPLKVDKNSYEAHLRALNNDIIEACLFYIEQEKTGISKLAKVRKKTRKLLI